jgi:hypothetical protein
MEIEWIKDKIVNNDFLLSLHGDKERQNDNLSISEIMEALINGIILENYDDTGRGESCLIAGFTDYGKPIHVVCGKMYDKVVIITVYIPSPPKFKNIYQRG